jgi:hypothetical protein
MYYGFSLDAAEDASVASLSVTPHNFVDDASAGSRYQKSGRRSSSADGPREQVGGGLRGEITEFSRQSRRRFQTVLASVPRRGYRPDRLLFVTLTYHNEWPDDGVGLKAHLGAWRKRIERRYGTMPMLWRLEYQGRGAPHWHLLVFAPEHLVPELSAEPQEFPFALALTAAWHEIVAPGDVAHSLYGVSIRQANSWNGAMFYLSKYMAKPEKLSVSGSIGRVWGVWHAGLLGITWRRWNLEYVHYIKLRRVLRRVCRYRKADAELRGMVCFVGWEDIRRLLNFYGLALHERGSPARVGHAGKSLPYVRPGREPEPVLPDPDQLSLFVLNA